MTTSEAPPTFPSLLSRKGTAGRYIFFFFFLLLSFFFFFFQRSLLLKQLGASDSGLWDISERCGSINEELGIWLEDPAAGPGLHAHRWRAAPANLGTDRVLLIVEKKKKIWGLRCLRADPGPIRAIISAPEVPPLLI